MANLNKVLLMGNLTRDPQLKYLPSQMAVVEFAIATNRKFRTASGEDREEVTFIDITSFGKQAEVINQYFTKGKPIFIEGRLKFDSWEDKNGGGKRSKLSVVVDRFEFIGGRDGPGGGGGGGGGGASGGEYSQGGYDEGGGGGGEFTPRQSRPAPARPQMNRPAARPQQQQPPAERPFGEETQVDDSDIPF